MDSFIYQYLVSKSLFLLLALPLVLWFLIFFSFCTIGNELCKIKEGSSLFSEEVQHPPESSGSMYNVRP